MKFRPSCVVRRTETSNRTARRTSSCGSNVTLWSHADRISTDMLSHRSLNSKERPALLRVFFFLKQCLTKIEQGARRPAAGVWFDVTDRYRCLNCYCIGQDLPLCHQVIQAWSASDLPLHETVPNTFCARRLTVMVRGRLALPEHHADPRRSGSCATPHRNLASAATGAAKNSVRSDPWMKRTVRPL